MIFGWGPCCAGNADKEKIINQIFIRSICTENKVSILNFSLRFEIKGI